MSNSVRNGFSTLNRLLGKKNKNPLSKSSTNLSKIPSTLDTTSQHNQIVPLAASTNAPFEQTFRITICLPLDQLYVVRVGAKTKLSTLLEMVCTNKLLDKEKFEFTHPINISQVFSLELTIGEVGLNEIRLAAKFSRSNEDSLGVKYRHSASIMSHQDNRYSARPHSAMITKSSPSPYSSTNSLNSTDSSGINMTIRSNGSHPPVAPTRKKRLAPRPPSQNSIPEDVEQRSTLTADKQLDDETVFKRPLDRKNFHVSSPNLTNGTTMNGGLRYKDFHVSNGNIYTINEPSGDNSYSGSDITNGSDGGVGKSRNFSRPMSMHCDLRYSENEHYDGTDENSNRFSYIAGANHSRTSSETSETTRDGSFPEPIPRKRVIVSKKKAPAPPPRSISASITVPVATPRSITPKIDENPRQEHERSSENDKAQPASRPSILKTKSSSNITKVMLNVENLQISIPDDSVNNNVLQIDSSVRSKKNEVADENIFQQKITHNSVHVSNGNCSSTKLNGDASELEKKKPGCKLTDDEKTEAIELNVNKKNIKNLNDSKEVRFKTIAQEEFDNYVEDIDHEELSKEITDIINKAVEINSAPELSRTEKKVTLRDEDVEMSFIGHEKEELTQEINDIIKEAVEISSSVEVKKSAMNGEDHTVNEKDIEPNIETPLWVYPLPAPDNFADNKALISKDRFGGGKERIGATIVTSSPYGKDASSDSFTEIPIQPIIKKKMHVDFQEFSDNSLPSSNTTETIASSSTDQDSIITSDIEDGYQGNDKGKNNRNLILNHEDDIHLKRDQFIENEFDFLSEHDDTKEESDTKDVVLKMSNLENERKAVNGGGGGYGSFESKHFKQKSNNACPTKADIIQELNNIITTNRLDSVIKKSEENDEIDAAKRSSLTNFQIRSYTKSVSDETSAKPKTCEENGHTDIPDIPDIPEKCYKRHSLKENKSIPLNGDDNETFAKPREFTQAKRSSLTLTNGHANGIYKSPRHINRSDSFHSTHQLQQNHLQSQFTGGYSETLSLTPRSSSYISLIGTQRYENKGGKQPSALGNGGFNETTRQKSTSELSIADSPSLQSLVVMKNILSNSRKNSLNSLHNESTLKVSSTSDDHDERNFANSTNGKESENTDSIENITNSEPKINVKRQLFSKFNGDTNKEAARSVISENQKPVAAEKPNVELKSAATEEPKKWKYQGPPAVSLSTWGERPKSQVVIKSDNDYKFGGIINNKKTLLQNRFSTAAIYDEPAECTKPKVPLHKRFSTPQVNTIEKIEKSQEHIDRPRTNIEKKQKLLADTVNAFDKGQDRADSTQDRPNPYARDYGRITPVTTPVCQEEFCKLPIVRGVEYKKNINLDENFIKNDQILQSKTSEDERVVIRSRSSYEVSRIVNEKPFTFANNGPSSLVYDQPGSTMTLGRVQIPNKFAVQRQTMNMSSQPFAVGNHVLQRNSSFSPATSSAGRIAPVVKGFKQPIDNSTGQQSLPGKDRATIPNSSPEVKYTTYDQEVRHIPIEKPAFAQFTLRKTGLKEKILDVNDSNEQMRPFEVQKNAKSHSTPPAPIFPKPSIANRHSVEPKNIPQVDSRDQLLDSIRNFSKNGLKKA